MVWKPARIGVVVAASVLVVAGLLAALGLPGGQERTATPRGAEGPQDSLLAEAPAPRGLDSALVAEAVRRAEGLPRLHTMLVARHGEAPLERHFRGPGPGTPQNVKSASKSILSALVGLAIEDGHLEGLDQPVAPFFADVLGDPPDPERSGITVGHLLSMSSGLASTSGRSYGAWVLSSNWVHHALRRPVLHAPGERMIYSTGSTHLLSALLVRATGRSTHAFARERLADPLGIRLPSWPTDPQGIHFGGNDMLVSPRDLLRFGELYRNGGTLDGQRILPEEWIAESWRPHARSPRNGDAYGLGWWGRRYGGHDVWFAWGYGGQFLFVVPDLELTVVFTSDPWVPREGPHLRSLHAIVEQLLVPAAIHGAAAAGADEEPGPAAVRG